MEIEVKGTKFKIGDVVYYYDGLRLSKYKIVGFSIDKTHTSKDGVVGDVLYILETKKSEHLYRDVFVVDITFFKTREELLEYHKTLILNSED